jgi:hypothetical protein
MSCLLYAAAMCDVQLETEGGAEDGEQHGRVAAENRTAFDDQYGSRSVESRAGETYL